MIDLEPQQQYPVFYNAKTKLAWTALNKQADDLLGFESEGATTYSNPIIDINGEYWMIIQPDVSSLVDLTKCVNYEDIKLPKAEAK